MFLHVKEAKHLHDYVVWLRFNDGAEGQIDLKDELEGEVFGPLKDERMFIRFRVDPELETLVWENGADLAPEFLYENMITVNSRAKAVGRVAEKCALTYRVAKRKKAK